MADPVVAWIAPPFPPIFVNYSVVMCSADRWLHTITLSWLAMNRSWSGIELKGRGGKEGVQGVLLTTVVRKEVGGGQRGRETVKWSFCPLSDCILFFSVFLLIFVFVGVIIFSAFWLFCCWWLRFPLSLVLKTKYNEHSRWVHKSWFKSKTV